MIEKISCENFGNRVSNPLQCGAIYIWRQTLDIPAKRVQCTVVILFTKTHQLIVIFVCAGKNFNIIGGNICLIIKTKIFA